MSFANIKKKQKFGQILLFYNEKIYKNKIWYSAQIIINLKCKVCVSRVVFYSDESSVIYSN